MSGANVAHGMEATGKKKKRLIAMRRQRLAQLYLRGITNHTELAEMLDVSRDTIRKDLIALEAEWKASAVHDFGRHVDVLFQKLQDREREAHAWWLRSQQGDDRKVVTTTTGKSKEKDSMGGTPPVNEVMHETRSNPGDPRYFQALRDIWEQYYQLVALAAPKDGSQPMIESRGNQTINLTVVSNETLLKLKDEMSRAANLPQIDHTIPVEFTPTGAVDGREKVPVEAVQGKPVAAKAAE